MLSEPEHIREESQGFVAPREIATIAILVANVLVFDLQQFVGIYFPNLPFDDYFALSLDGLKSGHIWQLITFQFMHGGYVHILFNLWAIFVFGRVVEDALGKWRMLTLYFLSGIAGGALQMLGTWLLPGLMDDVPVVGASAGAFGLVAAFAALFPNQMLYVLLFLVIPAKLRASTLLWIFLVFTLVGILFPLFRLYVPTWTGIRLLFDNLGHAAHLGGIITGYVFARQMVRQYPLPPVITRYSELH